jgi:hypothetical protein
MGEIVKPSKRRKLRFSLRLALLVMTLVCSYFACWRPTKTVGVADVRELLTAENHGVPVTPVAKAPLLLALEVYEIRSRPNSPQ